MMRYNLQVIAPYISLTKLKGRECQHKILPYEDQRVQETWKDLCMKPE
jgi:hypothetical protein